MSKTNSFLPINARKLLHLILFGIMMSMFNACELPNVIPDGPDPTLTVTVDGDQMVDFGVEVNLSGFASHSTGESTEVLWEITAQPSTSSLTLSNADQNSITFLPDALGEYVLRFTATSSDDLTAFDEVVITVIKAPVRLSGTLSSDRILENIYDDPNDPDYIVSGNVLVRAQLTIEPGVLIVFENNVGLSIEENQGSLIAIGKEDQPIRMTGVQKTKAFWKGVNILSRNPNNELKYVTIEYGGSGGFTGSRYEYNLMVNNGIIKVSDCRLTDSGGYGLFLLREDAELPNFKNNIITSNAVPAITNMVHYHYFDETTDFSGNEKDYIDYSVEQFAVKSKTTWKAINVPYRLGALQLPIDGELTIEPGSVFLGQPNTSLYIRSGSLEAIGTPSSKIIFKGEEDVRGYWKGLRIETNSNRNELNHVIVTNGGETELGEKSNVLVGTGGRVKMNNTTLSKSSGHGLIVWDIESTITSFENNELTDNMMPVKCLVNHFHYFDPSSDYTGNDLDVIDTRWRGVATFVNATWRKLDVPYRLPTSIEFIGSDITIEPGTEITSVKNGGLEVNNQGSLNAVGTPSEMITFRGDEDVQGFWIGLKIRSSSNNNQFHHVRIANGGDGTVGHKANIVIFGITSIYNSIIESSGGYGIRVQNIATFSGADNIFINNLGDDLSFE